MNIDELRQLVQLLDEKQVAEFELEEEGMKLRIRKAAASGGHEAGAPRAPAMPPAAAPPEAPAAGSPSPGPLPAAPPAETGDPLVTVVKSPIVGTFFRAPDPNSPPFVQVGDRVRVGQVLCIIEAMKLMNEIEAEIEGEILRIHHENGHPVQYGEPLFSIRP